jgi:mRNA interferase YafQ
MYNPVYTRQFQKDIKRCQRRGKDMEKFKSLARTLISGQPLDLIHRDHKLVGNFVGRREYHIESDWVLIYKIDGNHLIFERTGAYLDLFR